MKIAVAADHAGWRLKDALAARLRAAGHEILDLGAHDDTPSDYPDFAEAVAEAITTGRAERGLLVCGSGVGAVAAVNKMPGILAGLCHDTYSAHQGVEHDRMNVMALGARVVGEALAGELADAFVAAHFDGMARHQRRVDKVFALEARRGRSGG
ncbi:MAG TPA: RpiB/LacA/LacB family sugar-phosphate isomerase [Anaeromyxobacter sp.]|nr:RpiB/LacA/LacB family sugar-phosphate isomerase [Anaeromyxobacter sp.]